MSRPYAAPISATQIKIIHIAKGKLGIGDPDYRALLASFGAASCKDLNADQAGQLIDDLKAKGFKLVTKGRPRRLHRTKASPAAVSRDKQLAKIEALLTIGGLPWSYADGMARKICAVDAVAFVPDNQLYKLITALRKQAQRKGWDLTGEK